MYLLKMFSFNKVQFNNMHFSFSFKNNTIELPAGEGETLKQNYKPE